MPCASGHGCMVGSIPACEGVYVDVQSTSKRSFPGCENAAGKLSRSGKQQQGQNSPNLGTTF